ncbi:DNA-binding transcriptional MerR regulator [Nocardia alba]|uniref:DNA-binding transcriptional MerR regulator n=1 Tax=Nocardia alba TaxID=225051 RepID=A0A4R1FP95_9NOCA|nr:DNA-binding transcriptional MerR regulator [Nocardia alba]
MEVPAKVTHVTYLTIGELAARTGVAVRTVRYYCDAGLLDAARTATGHRVFEPDAVDRLALLRRLRSFGVGLTAIESVLDGTRSIAEVIAAERAAVDDELDALNRRRALLRAVESAVPEKQGEHLNLLAAVIDPRAAYDVLVAFWRRQLAPLPTSAIDGFLSMNVPELTAQARPEHLVAYAELVAAVSNPDIATVMYDTIRHRGTPGIRDERRLLFEVADACVAVEPLVAAGCPPHAGAELDRYVEVHATARGRRDTPSLRRQLLTDADHRIRRYWHLTATFTGDAVTSGAAQLWFIDALADSVTRHGEAGDRPPRSRSGTQGTTSTMSPGSSHS